MGTKAGSSQRWLDGPIQPDSQSGPGSVLEMSRCGAAVGAVGHGACGDTVHDQGQTFLCHDDHEWQPSGVGCLGKPSRAEAGVGPFRFVRDSWSLLVCEHGSVWFNGSGFSSLEQSYSIESLPALSTASVYPARRIAAYIPRKATHW